MRFELTVALKYLIPRWRQLSVSIISLISVLVISLVVWLVMLFLSVTEGIEKKWVEQLVALNAPVRMAPTEAYYNSYYFQIDRASVASDYSSKTIGEKLVAFQTDPYDPQLDAELPPGFPSPDRYENGSLKDVVKEAWGAAVALKKTGARPQEYEVSFGNLRLNLLREKLDDTIQQTYLNQVSYIASLDSENAKLQKLVLPLSKEDFNNLLQAFFVSDASSYEEEKKFLSATSDNIALFFKPIEKISFLTTNRFVLSPSLFPHTGKLKGIALVRADKIFKVIIPSSTKQLQALEKRLAMAGQDVDRVEITFEAQQFHLLDQQGLEASPDITLALDEGIPFVGTFIEKSAHHPASIHSLQFSIEGTIQGMPIKGTTRYQGLDTEHVFLKEASSSSEMQPFWIYPHATGSLKIPSHQALGEGILISKQFLSSHVKVGDRGYLAYYAPTASSFQEQRIPIYVAGFYDPGIMPIGNKLIFVDPVITSQLRDNMPVADHMLGNGINIWLDDLKQAEPVKQELIRLLKEKGLNDYWEVQSYHDYDFAKPLLQQLESDKHLFTLVALIILIVACSNIVSMLILLVNDKKREIGILQSMGASPKRIAVIFGMCGFITGLIGSAIGILIAVLTLHHLQSLVDFLSFLQGHEAFQTAYYGSQLPNELSLGSMLFVVGATLVISLVAGMIPAVKAARIRPTEILKAE